jgi:hypothetical protein
LDEFLNENLCLHNFKDLLKTMKAEKTWNILEPRDGKVSFALQRYVCRKRNNEKRLKFSELMQRPALEK